MWSAVARHRFSQCSLGCTNPRAEARYTKRRQVAALHIFSISQYKLLSLIGMRFALPRNVTRKTGVGEQHHYDAPDGNGAISS